MEPDAWYALIHDNHMGMNMRITASNPRVSNQSYITGLGVCLMGSDGEPHTVVAAVKNPYAAGQPTSCPDGLVNPCLAVGALRLTLLTGNTLFCPGR